MTTIHHFSFLLFPALTIVAALYDVASYRIPNWISLAIIAVFATGAIGARAPLATVGLCLAVGAMVLMIGFALFAARALGGGDAKLLAASALWFGWPQISAFLLCTILAGGVLALALMLMRWDRVRPLLAKGPAWLVRLSAPGSEMPYGVAIACGALAALPASPLAAS